eukprot:1317210-Prymnesium_polylepis.1
MARTFLAGRGENIFGGADGEKLLLRRFLQKFPHLQGSPRARPSGRRSRHQRGPPQPRPKPVSYTHLTLPTICSV